MTNTTRGLLIAGCSANTFASITIASDLPEPVVHVASARTLCVQPCNAFIEKVCLADMSILSRRRQNVFISFIVFACDAFKNISEAFGCPLVLEVRKMHLAREQALHQAALTLLERRDQPLRLDRGTQDRKLLKHALRLRE